MMINIEPLTYYLLLLSNTALLAAAALAIVRFQRLVHQSQQFWNSPTGSSLKGQQIHDDNEPARDNELEQRFEELQKQLSRLEENGSVQQGSATNGHPMENAVRMARRGASIDDLTRSCGLSVGEAELIRRLHYTAKPAPKLALAKA